MNWQLTPKTDVIQQASVILSLILLAVVVGHWASILLAPSPQPIPIHTLQKESNSVYEDAKHVFIGPSMLNANLSLKGVIVGSHHNGIAVLSINNGIPHPYREGNEISAGILLREVADNHVTIQRQGREETLTLPVKPTLNGITYQSK